MRSTLSFRNGASRGSRKPALIRLIVAKLLLLALFVFVFVLFVLFVLLLEFKSWWWFSVILLKFAMIVFMLLLFILIFSLGNMIFCWWSWWLAVADEAVRVVELFELVLAESFVRAVNELRLLFDNVDEFDAEWWWSTMTVFCLSCCGLLLVLEAKWFKLRFEEFLNSFFIGEIFSSLRVEFFFSSKLMLFVVVNTI